MIEIQSEIDAIKGSIQEHKDRLEKLIAPLKERIALLRAEMADCRRQEAAIKRKHDELNGLAPVTGSRCQYAYSYLPGSPDYDRMRCRALAYNTGFCKRHGPDAKRCQDRWCNRMVKDKYCKTHNPGLCSIKGCESEKLAGEMFCSTHQTFVRYVEQPSLSDREENIVH